MSEWKKPTSVLGAGALVTREGPAGPEVLLVRVAYGPAAGGWIFPGGKVEPGEHLAQAVCREVREETGLAVECGELLAVRHRLLDEVADTYFVFRASLADDNALASDCAPDEILEARFWPLAELLASDAVRPMTRAFVRSVMAAPEGLRELPLPADHGFKDQVWVASGPETG